MRQSKPIRPQSLNAIHVLRCIDFVGWITRRQQALRLCGRQATVMTKKSTPRINMQPDYSSTVRPPVEHTV